ncbi:MAG: IPT/TIG domain-containing protein [Bacteroidota bacterium]
MKHLTLPLTLMLGIAILIQACRPDAVPPSIASIDPVFGPAETLVIVEGADLGELQSITFSDLPINFNAAYNADHALLFRIPSDVPLGDHEVVLTSEKGSVSTTFRVTQPAPEIFEIFPGSASPGETVTIRGENFFEPLEVYFFDSIAADISRVSPDSLQVVVPEGIELGFVRVFANGGMTQSPERFFTINRVLVNDFDGNGMRAETQKWIFQGNVDQNGFTAVQNSNPDPIEGNFLKLSGTDDLGIQWIGGAQNHFGFPGDDFETFGLTTSPNNILLELDVNNNGRDNTHLILILNEKDGSPNDFTFDLHLDGEGWEHLSIPLNRFRDLNEVIVDPSKIRVCKIHLIDQEDSNGTLEVNVDNLEFIEIL